MADYYVDEYGNITKKKEKQSDYFVDLEGNVTKREEEIDAELAPILTTSKSGSGGSVAEKEEDKRTWFNKNGVFKDGYQFGDFTKMGVASIADATTSVMAGIAGMGEKVVDTGAYLAGAVGGLVGAKDFKEDTQDFIKKDLYDEREFARRWPATYMVNPVGMIANLILNGGKLDNTNAGEKFQDLAQSAGELTAQVGLTYLHVPWWLTTSLTSFGGEVDNALKEGATFEEAGVSAAITTGAELLTEKLFGGSGLGEKGLINLEPLTKGISSKVIKILADFGIDLTAEGIEEVASQFFSTLGQQLTYEKEETWNELLTNEEAMDSYLKQIVDSLFGKEAREAYGEAFIGGAVLSGGSNSVKVGNSIVRGRDYRTGLTANEEAVVNKEVENRIAEAEADGKKLDSKAKAEIREAVLSDLEKGYISTDTIESVLGGETYKSYQSTVDNENALTDKLKTLQEEFDTLNKMKRGDMTGEQTRREAELEAQIAELQKEIAAVQNDSQRNQLKSQLSTEVLDLIQSDKLKDGSVKDVRLLESYNERARRSQAFEADLTKYTGKQKEIIKKAVNSGILNNTRRTHEFVDMVAKISADKGVSFDFTNNAKLKESGFALNGKFVNGYITKDGITVNIQSSKSLNSVVGHEISHVLEGTELYNELQKSVIEYAKTKGDYQARHKTLTELYKGVEGADVNEELTADLVGDYLFTDTDFINNLSANHRNVFQKVYDEIKYLYKVATAGSKEARQLEKVKKIFDKVYKESGNQIDNDNVLKFSLDKYTQKQYNDFGWAKYAEAISFNELDDLYSKIHEKGSLKKFPQSSNGEAIIEVNDKPKTTLGPDNVFVFVTGTKNNPQIRKIIRFQVETDTEMEIIKEKLYGKGSFSNTYYSYIREQGFAREYSPKSALNYNEYKEKIRKQLSGENSNGTDRNSGSEQDRRRTFEETRSNEIAPINETSSSDDVFFDGNNTKNSLSDTDGNKLTEQETNEKLNKVGLQYDADSETVSFSLSSLEDAFNYNKGEADYLESREEYVKALAKATGKTREEANRYLDSLFLVHDMIAADKDRLDYEAAVDRSAWVSNSEYGGSIDFSTLCAKRRLFTGTFDAIQNALPDTVLTDKDFLNIRNLLLEKGEESPCSMCYVEGSRAKHGVYVDRWLKEYLKTNPEWKPQIADFTSVTRLEQTRIQHPEAYEAYQKAMNSLSQRKPKEASVRMDYKGEILEEFADNSTVESKNKNGGIRFNSFSDFEIVHALDAMQVITDMARVGLNGQAYTKVKEFAEAFGNTGLKINLSLVAKDVDENGRLIMDETNGMNYAEAMDIRSRYSDNVGTVIVVFNDAQLKAALADSSIDFVLPFYRSQWKKSQYALMGLPEATRDYTNIQNERYKNPNTGRVKKVPTGNIMPNEYWDFDLSGRENAQKYLDYINENSYIPKFDFLLHNVNGKWVLPEGAVGDGYFKLLIDFKMYNNDGWGSPQNPVLPEFNMPYIQQMLDNYVGGHQAFPVAHDVVEKFVEGKKNGTFSLSAESEVPKSYGKYNIYGRDIALETAPTQEADIAPMQETEQNTATVEEMFPDDNVPMTPKEEAAYQNERLASLEDSDAPPETEEPVFDELPNTSPLDASALKTLYNALGDVLHLESSDSKAFQDIVQKYSTSELPNEEQLLKDFKEQFGTRGWSDTDNEIVEAKRLLRKYRFNISESTKAEIADYGAFLRSNFGKVYTSKNGKAVDVAYEELSNRLPRLFPKSIINPTYQFLRIVEVANTDSEIRMEYKLTNEELQDAVDIISEAVSTYKEAQIMKDAEVGMNESFPYLDDYAPIAEEFETEQAEAEAEAMPEETPQENAEAYDPTKPIQTVKERLTAKLQHTQTELANNKALRAESRSDYDQEIARLKAEYNSKKNKNTKLANNILRRIEKLRGLRNSVDADYQKRISDLEAKVAKTNEEIRTGESPAEQSAMRRELYQRIIDKIKFEYNENGYELDEVLDNAKDLSTFATVDNTPQRVMEKSLGYKEGQVLEELTVNQVARNESEGIKWLNSFTDRKDGLLAKISKQYNIKPGSKESVAAQMYAEGFFVDAYDEIVKYGDAELAKDFPDFDVRANIKALAKDTRLRQIYDETLAMINASRSRNGYPEIQKLDNYFLHFRAMDDTFSKLGIPFNPNDIKAKDLPTDLNGVTADLKPGQPYFSSARHRQGKRTSFDLLGGLERYLSSAKDQIYHIDDIQTLRALRNYIADTYGQAKGLESLDLLTEEEAQERIAQVYNSHLSTFAKFLNEEANVIAGKTALTDRALEGIVGRRGIQFIDTFNQQVGKNMVGFNLSSSLTNFIPVVQTFAKTNKRDFVKAFAQTASNKVNSIFGRGDGFTENSPVIIRRKGADRFNRTLWEKASDAGYVFMSAVDNISTELIARTKYNELTRKGMDSEKAHRETDKWVSRLMGDRSLGQQPQLYNSKMLGLITKFQLEVRNQLDAQFYDTIQEAKVSNEDIQNASLRNAKTAAKVASTFVQLAVAQHLFGKAFEAVAGYNPAFDIIEAIIKAFGWDDDEDSEDTVLDNIEEGFLSIVGDLPYTSTFTGVRIPISSALPIEELVTGKDEYGNEKSRLKTLGESVPYLLPGGYGQIKKTVKGLSMFSDEHPIAGSYTNSGNLRFPVEETPLNVIRAGLFGQWANENARDYFDNERKPLTEKQIQELIDVDLPIREYWDYREGLKGLDTVEEKMDYVNSLDLPISKKNILINNLVDRKEEVDLTDYDQYTDYDEFAFATDNPERYAVTKAVGGYESFKKYAKALNEIKADKDENGKTINGSRKNKVATYINTLDDLDYGGRLILFKSIYKADDSYNYEIIEYLNSRDDLSYKDIETILTELEFTVDQDGTIWW